MEPAEQVFISKLKQDFELEHMAFSNHASYPEYTLRQKLQRVINWEKTHGRTANQMCFLAI